MNRFFISIIISSWFLALILALQFKLMKFMAVLFLSSGCFLGLIDVITKLFSPDFAEHSKQYFKKLFGRSLQLRQVSAAGCNACEADFNVLAAPFFDLARFGINFVVSPRYSDAVVVTGPVSRNMKTALLQTYEAMPDSKIVIAVGSCTIHTP